MNYEVNMNEARNDLVSLGHFNLEELTVIMNEFPTYLMLCTQFNEIPDNNPAEELNLY